MTKIFLRMGSNFTIWVLLAFLSFWPASLSAREVTDMYGRKVIVPDKISRVFSIAPSVTYLLYAIDPDLIAALNRPTPDSERPYIRKSYQDLPVLGGAFGNGLNFNLELILKLKPDVVIVWGGDGAYDKKTADIIFNLGIPVAVVDINSLSRYPDTFTFLGKLLSREKRANELADYARKALNEVRDVVSKIPPEKRISAYNARKMNGLSTVCEKSWHGELIPMAGGVNPVKCASGEFTGMETVSMEQALVMNPDVIVSMDASFSANVYRDERWQNIKAVKTKRIYSTPRLPLNWFDGPPSFMGLLGLQWLTQCFYPDLYPKDMEKEARQFIKLFFGMDLPQESIRKIIQGN